MKEYFGFKKNGKFYRGNIHSHTTMSDGMLTPEEAVKLYKENGYDFLCFSEHDLYTDLREKFNTEDFITIPATEISVILYREKGSSDRYKVHHCLGILGTQAMQDAAPAGLYKHMEELPIKTFYGEWDGQAAAQEAVDTLMAHGMVTTYNHPDWSRVTESDFIHTQGIAAMEVFNFNTVMESNTGYNVTHWDRMLRMGRKINAFASDDNHNEGVFMDSCGGWICVQSPDLTHDNIVQNFIDGNYYSSSGPQIFDWGVREDGTVWIDTSAVNRVYFVCGNYVNDGWSTLGDTLYTQDSVTHAEYKLNGHETYVRVEAVDKHGRTAWTNPIYLEW